VARGLEREWEERLRTRCGKKAELEHRERERPRVISETERNRLLALGPDLAAVWNAPTTTPRDRKEMLRTLIEEVTLSVDRDKAAGRLILRWRGGALNEIEIALPRSRPAIVRTDEDTIALVRRLAVHYSDGSLPASSIGKGAPRPTAIASPPAASAICAATGAFRAARRPPTRPKASS
jgi:hypothetical protein